MEKAFDFKQTFLRELVDWPLHEIASSLAILESNNETAKVESGKTLGFLFDLLEGDYLLRWFDTTVMQVMIAKVENSSEFRWVFGSFQSFVARLFFVYGEKEVRTMFREILLARRLSPLIVPEDAQSISFNPALINTMQISFPTTAAFFDLNPWAEALLAMIAAMQSDTRYLELKIKAAQVTAILPN